MRRIFFLLLTGLFVFASCNERQISHKREGLRPYHADEDTREAQESKE